MEDLSVLVEGSVEQDVIGLVKNNYSQTTFERSIRIYLGDNWQEDGLEIIRENAPELELDFKKYL